MRFPLSWALIAFAILLAATFALRFVIGTSPAVAFGGSVWIPVHAQDPWIPKSVALAMRDAPPVPRAGSVAWRRLAPGFEVGELPVTAEGVEVDRVLLARVDPARYRFVVQNEPGGDRNLDDWMRVLCAPLVINGSYYAPTGEPATPVVSDGRLLGPKDYVARQGAFVSTTERTGIEDLAQEDWRTVLRGAQSAMVSYPLLIAPDGSSRAPRGTKWLANRSFVGEDTGGRIILGTTKGSFFSLDRLALFLKQAPLGLKAALNLDGGPVACQGISLAGFDRRSCGWWEMQVSKNGDAKVLPTWPLSKPPMPIALAVFPKTAATSRCSRTL